MYAYDHLLKKTNLNTCRRTLVQKPPIQSRQSSFTAIERNPKIFRSTRGISLTDVRDCGEPPVRVDITFPANSIRYTAIELSAVGKRFAGTRAQIDAALAVSDSDALLWNRLGQPSASPPPPFWYAGLLIRVADIGKRYQRHHRAIRSRAICHQIPVTINIFSVPFPWPWKSPARISPLLAPFSPRWNVLHCKINAAIRGHPPSRYKPPPFAPPFPGRSSPSFVRLPRGRSYDLFPVNRTIIENAFLISFHPFIPPFRLRIHRISIAEEHGETICY